ncbi:hypothetical protein BRARA_I03610, partial [Brassica rapa]
ELNDPPVNPLPPLEKQLWSNLWKTKAPPKLKHFLWRMNSGALAVKAQLITRGIPLDATCSLCGLSSENICHVLFHCQTAKQVWERSNFPIPQGGWSQNSVFLNLHHLLACSKKKNLGASVRLAFPWILWHIWKARNAFCYENMYPDPSLVLSKAMEEAAVWLNLHTLLPFSEKTVSSEDSSPSWQKPPPLFLKCNVGASWDISSCSSGASWIVRDSKGVVLYHSRRAFSCIDSRVHADLTAISWAAEAIRDFKLKRVIFEISSDQAQTALDFPMSFLGNPHVCQRALFAIHAVSEAKLHLVQANCIIIANLIAGSVTRDHRHQFYVARNGPVWLSSQIQLEASS